jgi:DNA polymerase-3 subunit gamma/tau
MYLSSFKLKDKKNNFDQKNLENTIDQNNTQAQTGSQVIDQIRNIAQEEKSSPETKTEVKVKDKNLINSFDELVKICSQKKEIKLKYELEKNVNPVKFERNRIEISFNDNLDKDFVKDLSLKLLEWTDERWIISFSKLRGEMSIKEKQKDEKNILLNEIKNSEIYKNIMKKFPDAELLDIKLKKKED